jgi:hypothetical protein
MTGSSSPGLNALIADWAANRRERAIAAMRGSQALRDQIVSEIDRLEQPGRRSLLEQDEVCRQLHRILKALQAAAAEPLPDDPGLGV